MMTTRSTRPPFTATQWQELEHQAIIYKHLVSGVPIPPDLLFPFRRSMDLFPHQPLGWGCYHLGYGRKPDPEPGRCRRTDGKKWRCSKDAYPDSKYCERHMHRGRNRSRKPVELIPSTTPPTPSSSSVTSPITPSSYSISSEEINHSNNQHQHQHNHPFYNNNNNSPPLHPFLYSHSSSSTSPSIGYNNSTYVVPDSPFDKDYRTSRYANELKNERAFFTEASGTLRNVPESSLEDDPWGLTLTPQPKEKRYHSQSGYSQLQLQGFGDFSKAKDQQHHHHQDQYQHCFVLGTDFKSNRPMKVEREEPKQEQPLRHFFA